MNLYIEALSNIKRVCKYRGMAVSGEISNFNSKMLQAKQAFVKMLEQINPETYDYFGSYSYGGNSDVLNQDILKYILKDIGSHPEYVDAALENGGSYQKREDKSPSSIQRTYSIVYNNENGELMLYIEPKSKDQLGKKPQIPITLPKGFDKKLKIAFKVGSSSLEAQAALVVTFDKQGSENEEKKSRMREELRISEKFQNIKGFCKMFGVKHKSNTGQEKLTIYSPYQKDGTLEELMSNDKRILTKEEKIDISKQILEILVALSDKKISHHDIKPSNFLVKFDITGKPILSLIDFGYSLDFGKPETTKFTPQFVNPWNLSKRFDRERVKDLLQNSGVHDPLDTNKFEGYFLRSVKTANSAHDIYASGKILHTLLAEDRYGHEVYDNEQSGDHTQDLLKMMLSADSLTRHPKDLLTKFNACFPAAPAEGIKKFKFDPSKLKG